MGCSDNNKHYYLNKFYKISSLLPQSSTSVYAPSMSTDVNSSSLSSLIGANAGEVLLHDCLMHVEQMENKKVAEHGVQ